MSEFVMRDESEAAFFMLSRVARNCMQLPNPYLMRKAAGARECGRCC